MSSFPASSFNNTVQTGYGSPLYIIQSDITKTLESPNSINEIIDGGETEAQYSNVLKVPAGAVGFLPMLVVNATASLSSSALVELTMTVVATNTNPLRYYFMGRCPDVGPDYAYGSVQANLAGAVAPQPYGYWHGLGAWRVPAATGGGTASVIMYGDANNASAMPHAFSLPTASGLNRQFLTTLYRATSTTFGFEWLTGMTATPGTISSVVNLNSNSSIVPLMGCTHLTAFATHSTAAPTITLSATASAGTITINSAALGVRFIGEGL